MWQRLVLRQKAVKLSLLYRLCPKEIGYKPHGTSLLQLKNRIGTS
jgi:hypothetical protein